MAAFNLGVDTGLWELMAKNESRPQRVDDLAKKLGIDPVLLGAWAPKHTRGGAREGVTDTAVLLARRKSKHEKTDHHVPTGRLLRHLGAMGYIEEMDEDEYRPTNFTQCLSLRVIGDGYPAVLSSAKAPIMFHEYARARGWANPDDSPTCSPTRRTSLPVRPIAPVRLPIQPPHGGLLPGLQAVNDRLLLRREEAHRGHRRDGRRRAFPGGHGRQYWPQAGALPAVLPRSPGKADLAGLACHRGIDQIARSSDPGHAARLAPGTTCEG